MKKKYSTEEERKAAKDAYKKQWYQEHKVERAAKMKQWYQDNKAAHAARKKQYHSTPFGRASYLASGYRAKDKNTGRGECTITPQWIVDNVFSGQCCHYCGESDWMKLGLDRKDSSLPHTPENCVPCCEHCNKKKYTTPYEEYLKKVS